MKKVIRQIAVILLTALVAIGAYEFYWRWTDSTYFHREHLRNCISTYEEYEEILNAALPGLRDLDTPRITRRMILDPISAYVSGESADAKVIDIPLNSIGDFYRHTYSYGLIWAADYDRLLAQYPEMILVSLADGWCAYVITRHQ